MESSLAWLDSSTRRGQCLNGFLPLHLLHLLQKRVRPVDLPSPSLQSSVMHPVPSLSLHARSLGRGECLLLGEKGIAVLQLNPENDMEPTCASISVEYATRFILRPSARSWRYLRCQHSNRPNTLCEEGYSILPPMLSCCMSSARSASPCAAKPANVRRSLSITV